jgi:hypothetical protein
MGRLVFWGFGVVGKELGIVIFYLDSRFGYLFDSFVSMLYRAVFPLE